MKTRRQNRLLTIYFYAVIVVLYVPLGYLVFQAFLRNPHDWSSGFTLTWLANLFSSSDLWAPLWTSIRIAALAASLSVVLGTLGAVGLTKTLRQNPPWLQSLITLPILLPELITGLSLLLFFLLLQIPLGFWTVVIAHASFSASFVYFTVAEQLKKLDPQIEEAAQDLGAEPTKVFWKITFPNILPGIGAGWLLAFTLSFDDFLISFFTGGAGVTTLPLKIYSLMRLGVSPELNALSCVMLLFSALLVILLLRKEDSQKWVVKG